jgi:2-oxo-3-hexenedioate decarboxylase
VSVVAEVADYLANARAQRTAVGRASERWEFSLADGYAVQDELGARRVAAGERIIGAKLGLTSVAKQQQMNVHEPLYGMLYSGCVHPSDAPLVVAERIHPRVEPEIVFIIGERLEGPGVTAADVLAATRAVCCGLEILDSRYKDFSFTAADVVADNTSESGLVFGPRLVDPDELDLALTGLILEVDGDIVATASGAASMGHPAEAVAMLANHLGTQGMALEPGWTVFSGGLTAAVGVNPGTTVRATFGHLGSVGVRGV